MLNQQKLNIEIHRSHQLKRFARIKRDYIIRRAILERKAEGKIAKRTTMIWMGKQIRRNELDSA